MDLLVLAIGLVLGGACVYAMGRVRSVHASASETLKQVSVTLENHKLIFTSLNKLQADRDKHDHEIAALYDKTNMRRN